MRHFSIWLKKNIVNVILLGILFTGVGLIAYPSVSNWYNSYHHSLAVLGYAENVAELDPELLKQVWESAETYNKEVAKNGNDWMPSEEKIEAYKKELDIDGTGVMGYIQIQKIDVKLPLYHTTDSKVLQYGVGHLSGTSLPVGGESSHCVLSGHRGLPEARLFTDLDKLVVGDTFQLNILNRTLTYEVDQIRIVEPTDFSDLTIEEGQDYCTLLTCTPYGINTHRMLVRGHRTATKGSNAVVPSDAMQYEPVLIAPFFAAPVLLIALVWMLVTTSGKGKRRRSREKALSEMLDRTEDNRIGHIEGTSFPVGGIGTHAAVSGHRGLPSAKLFTDIDQLKEGDRFLLQVLDRTLTYEVDQIRIVLPEELQYLEIFPDQDYCTLITCTPYGVNTHRLLVRGHRVENDDTDVTRITADAIQFEPIIVAPLVAAPILLVLLIILLISTSKWNRRRRVHKSKDEWKDLIETIVDESEANASTDPIETKVDESEANASTDTIETKVDEKQADDPTDSE